MLPTRRHPPAEIRPPASGIRHRSPAFTLIEVTIAVGITATGVLLLVALSAVGIDSSSEAMGAATARRVASDLIDGLAADDWREIGLREGIRLFDAEGLPLDSADTGDVALVCRIRVPARDLRLETDDSLKALQEGGAPTSEYGPLPGESAAPSPGIAGGVRRVLIDVADLPLAEFDFDDPRNAGRFRTFSALLPNTRSRHETETGDP